MSWHTVKEAAPIIGLSEDTVYSLCASGRLAHRRLGLNKGRGRIQISDEAIERFLKACEVAEAPAPAPQGSTRKRAARTTSGRPDGLPFRHLKL